MQANGDRLWLALATSTGVAVDVTLNKYSSVLPWYVVVGLWMIPACLFIIWFWRVERTTSWVKHRFLEHPVSYVLMFLVLIPIGFGITSLMIDKFRKSPALPANISHDVTPHNAIPIPSLSQVPVQISSPAPPPTKRAILASRFKPETPTEPAKVAVASTQNPAIAIPPPPSGGQTCYGSNCFQGTNFGSVQQNQFGPPLPRFTFTEDPATVNSDGIYVMKVHIRTDISVPGAIVGVAFSGPIDLGKGGGPDDPKLVGSSAQQISWGGPLGMNGALVPNSYGFMINMPAAFMPQMDLVITAKSKEPVHVLQVNIVK
ncbi:hypothetical protein SAMN05421771_4023 [Granulicella pectinivorans]|uniref:Uncharacterized protein n=1 Tax=Granulicella pectinivorans TaxID=474950 RepID=A0A1I6MZC4_9BACT|nr:hypothetical protein SAMN05421771_4023 [Granulicella pectinivorans]